MKPQIHYPKVSSMHEISYIILAHKNPAQIERIIKSLSDEGIYFYVHIDLNSNMSEFNSHLDKYNVNFIQDRVACSWGDFSIVKATLKCIERILMDNRKGHSVLLSGQDFPIKSNSDIKKIFEENTATDFIDCRPIKEVWPNHFKYRTQAVKYNLSYKKADFVCILSIFSLRPKAIIRNTNKLLRKFMIDKDINHLKTLKYLFIYKKPPKNIDFFGGSQWWSLTNETLNKIFLYINNNNKFITFFENSVIPDEVFFQTAIMKLKKFDSSIFIRDTLTYTRWKSKTADSPDTFLSADYNEILLASRDYCFARKFDVLEDEGIMISIEKNIGAGENIE